MPILLGVALMAWASTFDIPAPSIPLIDLAIPASPPPNTLRMPSFPSSASIPSVYSKGSALDHPSPDAVSQTCEICSSWSDEERALNTARENNPEDCIPHCDLSDYVGANEESEHSIDSGRPQDLISQPLDTSPSHPLPVKPTPTKPKYQVATLNWASQTARSSSPVRPLPPVSTVAFQAPRSPPPAPRRLPSPPSPDVRGSSRSSTAIGSLRSDLDTLVPSAPNPKSKGRLRRLFGIGKDTLTPTLPQTSPLSQELKGKSWFRKFYSAKIETRK